MGFASSIMLCAFFFLLVEVKERCWRAKGDECPLDAQSFDPRGCPSGNSLNGGNGQPHRHSRGNTSSGSTKHNDQRLESQFPSIQSTQGAPLYPDRLHLDDISMSQLSAMTESVAFDGKSKANKLKTTARTITLLDEEHRVPSVTKLQTLVNLSEIPASSFPSSRSLLSAKAASVTADSGSSIGRDTAHPIVLYQADNLGSLQETKSAMTDGSGDEIQGFDHANDGSFDEDSSIEDESGWTSSAGQSDSSSDMSVATFLKSICSAKSLSSVKGKTARPCFEDSTHQTSDKEGYGADNRDDVDSQTDEKLVEGIDRIIDNAQNEEIDSNSKSNFVSVGSIKGREHYPSQHSRKDDATSLLVACDGSSEDFKDLNADKEHDLLKIHTETESHLPYGIMQYNRFRVAVEVLSHKEAYEGQTWRPLMPPASPASVDAFEWGREMLQRYRPENEIQDGLSSLTEDTNCMTAAGWGTTVVNHNTHDEDHESIDVIESSVSSRSKHHGLMLKTMNAIASSNGSITTV